MPRTIEKNEDGTLTEEQGKKLTEAVAKATLDSLAEISKLTAEQLVDIVNKRVNSEHLLPLANTVFEKVVDADLPIIFTKHIGSYTNHIISEVFEQVSTKLDKNEQTLVSNAIGFSYDDISPKDIIEYLNK